MKLLWPNTNKPGDSAESSPSSSSENSFPKSESHSESSESESDSIYQLKLQLIKTNTFFEVMIFFFVCSDLLYASRMSITPIQIICLPHQHEALIVM